MVNTYLYHFVCFFLERENQISNIPKITSHKSYNKHGTPLDVISGWVRSLEMNLKADIFFINFRIKCL